MQRMLFTGSQSLVYCVYMVKVGYPITRGINRV
nr:MAG TPA: hypothetical protein [Caudoviricetes sp.]